MRHSKPNILLLMTDEHASDVAGFAGDTAVDTNHLDRLAERSVYFPNTSCTNPVCTPSRMSLFPGYNNPESAGVTEIPESLIQDVVATRETLAFLRENADIEPDKPWFLCASFGRPHSPLTAPGRYIRHYRDKVPPPIPNAEAGRDLEPFAQRLRFELTDEQTTLAREAYYACRTSTSCPTADSLTRKNHCTMPAGCTSQPGAPVASFRSSSDKQRKQNYGKHNETRRDRIRVAGPDVY